MNSAHAKLTLPLSFDGNTGEPIWEYEGGVTGFYASFEGSTPGADRNVSISYADGELVGDEGFETSNTGFIEFPTAGDYLVTLTVTNGEDVATKTERLTIPRGFAAARPRPEKTGGYAASITASDAGPLLGEDKSLHGR